MVLLGSQLQIKLVITQMAEGQVKEVLEREVTCPLCLDVFQEPKKLPCDHVYCKHCLEGITRHRGLQPTLPCPECRATTQIPDNDIDKFPTDFRINRLVEAFHKVTKCPQNDSSNGAQCEAAITNCTQHPTQPLALYCETCKHLLCRDCVIMTGTHAHHVFDYIDKVADSHRNRLKGTLSEVRKFSEILTALDAKIANVEDEIAHQEGEKQREIDDIFQGLMSVLETKRDGMKRRLTENHQSIRTTLNRQRLDTKAVHDEVKDLSSSINSTLEKEDKFLLTHQESLLRKFESMHKKVANLPQDAIRKPLMVPKIMNNEALKGFVDQHSFMHHPVDPKMCCIRDFVSRAEMGKSYSVILNLVDLKGNLYNGALPAVVAELRSIRDLTVDVGRVEQISSHCIQITFEPHTRGRHELSLTVNGEHVRYSPTTCYFYKNPENSSQPIATIESLQRPTGLARHGDSILAVEHARNRILRLSTSFEVVGRIGEGILRGPSEVTSDHNMNIYVCTIQDNKVHKFDKNGALVKSIGSTGARPGEFKFPNGVRVNHYGEVYVCDSGNDRIQVFDLDLHFKRVFGSQGSGKRQLKCPSDIDFDADDNIFVVDTNNHRIQVFSRQERYLRTIGQKRFGSKELVSPINMHISEDQLFVTEHEKSHVTVFKTSGELWTTFGNHVLSNPEGIEVDKDGYVYVTSDYNKIVVF